MIEEPEALQVFTNTSIEVQLDTKQVRCPAQQRLAHDSTGRRFQSRSRETGYYDTIDIKQVNRRKCDSKPRAGIFTS